MPQNPENVLDHMICSGSRNTRRCSRTRRRTSKIRSRTPKLNGFANGRRRDEYREKNFAREALTVNPAKACQPLGAVFAAVGFEQNAAVRAWLARLRRLLPQPFLASLQGADILRLLVDDRRRRGVRRPQQHDRRLGQHLQYVQAEDDRGLDHLHGRGHRRRPQRLHQDGEGKGLGSAGIRRSFRSHAGFRRQPHHRLRQCDEGHRRAFLGWQGQDRAEAGARSEREDQLHRRLRRLHGRQPARDQAHLRSDGVDYTILGDNSDVWDTPDRWRVPHVRRRHDARRRGQRGPRQGHHLDAGILHRKDAALHRRQGPGESRSITRWACAAPTSS